MKRIDLEKMLTNQQDLQRIQEQALAIFQKYHAKSEPSEDPVETCAPAHIPEHILAAPKPHLTDFDFAPPGDVANLFGAADPVEKPSTEDPAASLSHAVEICRSDPSKRHQRLVANAINAVTAANCCGNPKLDDLVHQAIDMLSKLTQPEGDSVWGQFFQHSNYNGWSLFYNLMPGYRYYRVDLSGSSYNDAISSLRVGVSVNDFGLAGVFENTRFVGRYGLYPTNTGSTSSTSYVGGFLNDRTTSILLVRRASPRQEVSISLSTLHFDDRVAEMLKGVRRVSPRGNPIISWDMWPSFASTRRFIYVRVPVTVDVPNWFDYDAELRLWLELSIDGAGALHAYVAFYGCWVESGVKSGSIANQIMPALAAKIPDINSTLASSITPFAGLLGPLQAQYFLPGTAAASGNTDDDVTIVLVKR